jgi:hypothetical protein
MVVDLNNFGEKKIPRKDFLKIMGAGSLFLGLGALGIPNDLKNIEERQRREQMQQIQPMLLERLQQIQLMLQEQV